MKLYYSPGACSLASHIALVEAGEPYEKVKVDLGKHETENGEDFYKINPRGYVPAVEAEGIGLLSENSAVLPFIADRTGTLPGGEAHFRLHEWIGFIGTEIHAAYHPLFGGAEGAEKDEAKQTVVDKYELAVKLMDGSDWLVTDGPTVADNYLFVTTLWADKFDVELPEAISAFKERNMERPAVKQAMQEEGLG